MKICYFILGVLSLNKNLRFISGKSLTVTVTATDKSVGLDFENYMNCSQNYSSTECLEQTGVTS